jgi:hypothetical protein
VLEFSDSLDIELGGMLVSGRPVHRNLPGEKAAGWARLLIPRCSPQVDSG